ncbi:chemotaxis protein CheB [Teredinibacter sp. KSP-S5-2]|uniref:chemotaxis protein CheB n=1 Tax=Teredinibacter sp. KSP-S5-2 TaxID=3034506 RepID=UPI002934CE6A|nr:chemotaxis protein CheB [Teredinibacter sp. KSP-S5-2]WNO09361.1 chemotaxis protein CheB [Teredinibacter sp. KSP-S5-2]
MKLGLIADTSVQIEDLKTLVLNAGYEVGVALKVGSAEPEEIPAVDAWVVRIGPSSDDSYPYVESLGDLDIPVIFDEVESFSSMENEERIRRFVAKLERCATEIREDDEPPEENTKQKAKEVWVLAASTGGPEAVSNFLSLLPPDIRGTAFIYVQHIDRSMHASLTRTIAKNSQWKLRDCEKTRTILEQEIYLVSPEHQIEFSEIGTLYPVKQKWMGLFHPSIDQVIARTARRFGKNSGAIIFSGMGDDGALSCRFLKNIGGRVWAQSPESCTIDSMPQHAIDTGCVSFLGTPEKLAAQFSLLHGHNYYIKTEDQKLENTP